MRSMRNTASSSLATFRRCLASSSRGGMTHSVGGRLCSRAETILSSDRANARASLDSPLAGGRPDPVRVQPGVHCRSTFGRHRAVAAPALVPAQFLAVQIAQRDEQLTVAVELDDRVAVAHTVLTAAGRVDADGLDDFLDLLRVR